LLSDAHSILKKCLTIIAINNNGTTLVIKNAVNKELFMNFSIKNILVLVSCAVVYQSSMADDKHRELSTTVIAVKVAAASKPAKPQHSKQASSVYFDPGYRLEGTKQIPTYRVTKQEGRLCATISLITSGGIPAGSVQVTWEEAGCCSGAIGTIHKPQGAFPGWEKHFKDEALIYLTEKDCSEIIETP
jgi:hypothetical protein